MPVFEPAEPTRREPRSGTPVPNIVIVWARSGTLSPNIVIV